jgi:hypothetical protein
MSFYPVFSDAVAGYGFGNSSFTQAVSNYSSNAMQVIIPIVALLSAGLGVLSSPLASSSSPSYCKPVPGDAHWPEPAAWAALNASINGVLLATSAPGEVCHPDSSSFDNASCAQLATNWINSSWQADHPVTSDYNDDTCRLEPGWPCSADGYPAYTVNASEASHVVAAVKFARDTGVRLVVKGTGHDYPGRYVLALHESYAPGVSVE